jgi:hypothetical protein
VKESRTPAQPSANRHVSQRLASETLHKFRPGQGLSASWLSQAAVWSAPHAAFCLHSEPDRIGAGFIDDASVGNRCALLR